jgi:hypothetical protein
MVIGIIFRRDTTHTISGLKEEEETEFGKRIADLLWRFRCPCTHVIFARYTIMQHAARTFSTFIKLVGVLDDSMRGRQENLLVNQSQKPMFNTVAAQLRSSGGISTTTNVPRKPQIRKPTVGSSVNNLCLSIRTSVFIVSHRNPCECG